MSDSIPAILTIDGPSGSGKGTISQLVAQKLGFQLLDSGALYRLVALATANHTLDFENEEALATLAAHLDARFDSSGDSTVIMLEGEDVTDAIRTETVSMNASRVAAIESVREALLQRQREFAGEPGLVADGRDMGTTVFPAADVKIFLTASAEERAQRRYKQLINKGESVSLPALLDDIQARDRRDMERSASPLKPAADAHVLDSSKMSIQQVLEAVLAKAADKGIEPPVAE